MVEQNDPNIDTIAALQRNITATLTYIMGRASVAELFGLQAYVRTLASQLAPVHVVRCDLPEMPSALRQQLAEIERQSQQLRQGQGHYRPES